jgi:oligogalacturonide lyase
MKTKNLCTLIVLLVSVQTIYAQIPVMTTGGQIMPNEWIDQDTGHKVIKLTRRDGINMSFYFHNNPFVGDDMIFCGGNKKGRSDDNVKKEIYNMNVGNLQMYKVNLKTLGIEQITDEKFPVHTEIVCKKTKEIFYQNRDSVISFNIATKKRKLVCVLPNFYGIVTVNKDGTFLAGTYSDSKERDIYKNNPAKKDFFNLIYDAKLLHTLFLIDLKTGKVSDIYSEKAWLNHLQFSPTDPHLLMFCHEGPWHKVDRIWTIDVVKKGRPHLIHERTMDMEIAGHEWFGADGKHIYFDLQKPRGETFFVGKVDLKTYKEQDFELQRNEWSVHYTTSWKEDVIAGDGGDSTSVAKAKDGKWLYLFHFDGKNLKSTKLVNMKNHNYHLEPNIHFSPDDKWIIFRANFEGFDNVYAVER